MYYTESQYRAMSAAARHPLAKHYYSIAAGHARDYASAMEWFKLAHDPAGQRWHLDNAAGSRRNAYAAETEAKGWESRAATPATV